jgi:hypothetical protein
VVRSAGVDCLDRYRAVAVAVPVTAGVEVTRQVRKVAAGDFQSQSGTGRDGQTDGGEAKVVACR